MRPAPHSWSAPNRKGLAGTSGICDHAGRARPEASRSKGAGKGGASVARTEPEMSTVANAWVAFIRALEDARDMQQRGAEAHPIADLLCHARELLDVIDDEIVDGTPQTVADARAVLAELRGRLESLEQDVMPIRH